MSDVSSEMTTINGTESDVLRKILSLGDSIIRRSYNVRTGKAEPKWLVTNASHVAGACVVSNATVERWRRCGFGEFEGGAVIDGHDRANEYFVLNRCVKCQRVGFVLNSDWECANCT